MGKVADRVLHCLKCVRNKTDFVPRVALILGSGLGDLADQIDAVTTIDYSEIDGFPQSTVVGHKGTFFCGYQAITPVVLIYGRGNYYDGYTIKDVVLPIFDM